MADDQFSDALNNSNSNREKYIKLLQEEKRQFSTLIDLNKKIAIEEEIRYHRMQQLVDAQQLRIDHEGQIGDLTKEQTKEYNKQVRSLKKDIALSTTRIRLQHVLNASLKSFTDKSGIMRTYFMDADKAIKSTTLQLGLSGIRADMLRNSFEDSAGFAARLGVDMTELAQMVSVYADETGRARLLNEQNQQAIVLMAKGTSMGAESAARMAGQYELMGFSALDTSQEVQRIVDTSERMGVNTSNVFKSIGKNFKTMQKFTFQDGVKSIANMAIYAEKFKMDMGETIKSMESMRTLEGAVDAAAKLQVLGGEFAKLADPMQMLFESRNDPEAYMKRINGMTKGLVTLKKTSEGFSFDIASPMALDMMNRAADALGMTTDELTQQALRMREMQQTRQQMFGKGFTSTEKDLIEGLAQFNTDTGRMFVEIGGVKKDVAKVNQNDLSVLKQQSVSLKKRAEDSQTFDQVFTNTVNELKANLLPMLRGVNGMLTAIRPFMDKFAEAVGGLSKGNKGLMTAAGTLLSAVMALGSLKVFFKGMGFFTDKFAKVAGKVGGKMFGGGVDQAVGAGTVTKGGGGVARGASQAGKGMMRGGIGIGAAGLGIGAGVGVAAMGISKLADSMSKLSDDKAEVLENIAMTLAISFPAAAVGLAAFAKSAQAGAFGLLAVGGAALGIGAGIGIAAAGIGHMAENFAKLDNVDLSGIGSGMLQFAGAASLIAVNPMAMLGMASMSMAISSIADSADGMERVGNAFYNIGAVLKGSSSQFKEVKDTIQSIANTEVDGGLGQLMQILSKPLKVQFDENTVSLVANVDLNVDGSELKRIVTDPAYMSVRLADQQGGLAGSS